MLNAPGHVALRARYRKKPRLKLDYQRVWIAAAAAGYSQFDKNNKDLDTRPVD
jgi:hypothetical protein